MHRRSSRHSAIRRSKIEGQGARREAFERIGDVGRRRVISVEEELFDRARAVQDLPEKP
jgi:hypothetical protein